jgi:hypothetical protein
MIVVRPKFYEISSIEQQVRESGYGRCANFNNGNNRLYYLRMELRAAKLHT